MPAILPPLVPEAQPPAVRTAADVLALMRREVRESENAPVRDALIALTLGVLFEFQYRSDLAEQEADLLRATTVYLRELGTERGFSQLATESDADFRERMLDQLGVVTKDAIVAAVNALLSPFTATECVLLECSLDGLFINDGTDGDGNPAIWHSFIGATPSYPDRFFEGDEEQNDGVFRPNSDPGGARIFDGTRRQFLLLVPDLTGFSDFVPFLWEDAADEESEAFPAASEAIGWFLSDGSDPDIEGSYIYLGLASESSLYDGIVRTVNLLAGQSISWWMHATLEAA